MKNTTLTLLMITALFLASCSNDGSKQYLLGDDGLNHAQLIEKGLMGACFYYQPTAVYMGDDRMNLYITTSAATTSFLQKKSSTFPLASA